MAGGDFKPTTMDLIFVGIGAVGMYLIASKVPSLVTSQRMGGLGCTKCSGRTLENIGGIDTEALYVARQKGLI